MKRIVISFCMLALLLAPAICLAAVDLSVGGIAWYTWWKPAWSGNTSINNDVSTQWAGIYLVNASDFKTGSGAMGGPVISIGFLEKWSVSTMLVMGKFKYKTGGGSTYTDYLAPQTGDPLVGGAYKIYTRDVLKWDCDTTLAYALNRYFKVYAGLKAQGYRYKETQKYYNLPPLYERMRLTDDVYHYGPGIGIGITVPLVENFYLLVNLSGIVLWGKEEARFHEGYFIDASYTTGPALTRLPRGTFMSYGGTGSLSFAYRVEKINTTLALGGRYQVLYYRQRSGNVFRNDVTLNIIDRQYDHFFGMTLSAIYTFHIGS